MKPLPPIVSDPRVMMGKPVFTGTRIPVDLILEKLSAGETAEQLLAAYPALSATSIRAALAFAAGALRSDVVFPVSTTTLAHGPDSRRAEAVERGQAAPGGDR